MDPETKKVEQAVLLIAKLLSQAGANNLIFDGLTSIGFAEKLASFCDLEAATIQRHRLKPLFNWLEKTEGVDWQTMLESLSLDHESCEKLTQFVRRQLVLGRKQPHVSLDFDGSASPDPTTLHLDDATFATPVTPTSNDASGQLVSPASDPSTTPKRSCATPSITEAATPRTRRILSNLSLHTPPGRLCSADDPECAHPAGEMERSSGDGSSEKDTTSEFGHAAAEKQSTTQHGVTALRRTLTWIVRMLDQTPDAFEFSLESVRAMGALATSVRNDVELLRAQREQESEGVFVSEAPEQQTIVDAGFKGFVKFITPVCLRSHKDQIRKAGFCCKCKRFDGDTCNAVADESASGDEEESPKSSKDDDGSSCFYAPFAEDGEQTASADRLFTFAEASDPSSISPASVQPKPDPSASSTSLNLQTLEHKTKKQDLEEIDGGDDVTAAKDEASPKRAKPNTKASIQAAAELRHGGLTWEQFQARMAFEDLWIQLDKASCNADGLLRDMSDAEVNRLLVLARQVEKKIGRELDRPERNSSKKTPAMIVLQRKPFGKQKPKKN